MLRPLKWFLKLIERVRLMYKNIFKRWLDFTISVIALFLLFIPMLLISIAIKLDSEGPGIFKQIRLGKNRQEFTIYKFRTMVKNVSEKDGIVTRSSDARITKVGSFLRKTSLDEILQFINVLKGEMSIIGPRPILPIQFEPYLDNPRYCKRYEVLPGLSCTIDIKNRASFNRDLQFEMDADYVDHISFIQDFKICILLAKTVFFDRKIYEDEE